MDLVLIFLSVFGVGFTAGWVIACIIDIAWGYFLGRRG